MDVNYVGLRIRRELGVSHERAMGWMSVRLELASSPGFPRGSASRAFLLRLPLDEHGMIDGAAVRGAPAKATVRRFWASEPDMAGKVVKQNGGWALQCGRRGASSTYLLRNDPLLVDEILSIEADDKTAMPFRVISIDPINASVATS